MRLLPRNHTTLMQPKAAHLRSVFMIDFMLPN